MKDLRNQTSDVNRLVPTTNLQTVNVSGTSFQMTADTWTKMQRRVSQENTQELVTTPNGIFTGRHPLAFQCILQYYQSGELHLPTDLCPSTFKR